MLPGALLNGGETGSREVPMARVAERFQSLSAVEFPAIAQRFDPATTASVLRT